MSTGTAKRGKRAPPTRRRFSSYLDERIYATEKAQYWYRRGRLSRAANFAARVVGLIEKEGYSPHSVFHQVDLALCTSVACYPEGAVYFKMREILLRRRALKLAKRGTQRQRDILMRDFPQRDLDRAELDLKGMFRKWPAVSNAVRGRKPCPSTSCGHRVPDTMGGLSRRRILQGIRRIMSKQERS